MKRIIITGGPSSGKTSLIDELASRGLAVCSEKAREVIKKQISIDPETAVVPWKNVLLFSKEVVAAIWSDNLLDLEEELVFFDRGVPDVLGYLNHAGLIYEKKPFLEACANMRYSNLVFFLPPWKEIFQNDTERKETFEEAVSISEEIKKSYLKLGFRLVEVPKKNIAERIVFILSAINESS